MSQTTNTPSPSFPFSILSVLSFLLLVSLSFPVTSASVCTNVGALNSSSNTPITITYTTFTPTSASQTCSFSSPCRIDCSNGNCIGKTIQCPTDQHCIVSCGTTDGCRGSTIICPTALADSTPGVTSSPPTCQVLCTSPQSCVDSNIYCPNGEGSCSVDCHAGTGQQEPCLRGTVNCGGLADTGNGPCLVSCYESKSACQDIIVNGPSSTTGTIPYRSVVLNCGTPSQQDECKGAIVNCRNASNCALYCENDPDPGTSSVVTCESAKLNCQNTEGYCAFACDGDSNCASSEVTCTASTSDNLCFSQTNGVNNTCGTSVTTNVTNYCPLGVACTFVVPPSLSPTPSFSVSLSRSRSRSSSSSPSVTKTISSSSSRSLSSSPSSSGSSSRSRSFSPSPSRSLTPSETPTISFTPTVSPTSRTLSLTPTISFTSSPSRSFSLSSSQTPSSSTSPSNSIATTSSQTPSSSVSETPTPTSPFGSPSPSVSQTPSVSRTTSLSPRVSPPSPSRFPSNTPSNSIESIIGLTCEDIICEDDDPCTVEICLDGICTHQLTNCDDSNICTQDSCSSSTGECLHELISGCEDDSSTTCRSLQSCDECSTTSGCAWLECRREDSGFANVTTVSLNTLNSTGNSTQGLIAFYTFVSIPAFRKFVQVKFRLGTMDVYVADQEDFVSIGNTQGVFQACLREDAVDAVSNQYDPSEVICEVNADCAILANQLQAQVSTISTSVGAAGGGGIGCFCGSCVIALLYFKRKKKPTDAIVDPSFSVVIDSNEGSDYGFKSSSLFNESEQLLNPLFQNN